jgi:hypothetical protein
MTPRPRHFGHGFGRPWVSRIGRLPEPPQRGHSGPGGGGLRWCSRGVIRMQFAKWRTVPKDRVGSLRMERRRRTAGVVAFALLPAVALALTTGTGMAAARQTHVVCWSPHLRTWHEHVRPRKCNIHVRHRNLFYELRGLHWKRHLSQCGTTGWHHRTALAYGYLLLNGGGRTFICLSLTKPRWGWGPTRRIRYFAHAIISSEGGPFHRFWTDVPSRQYIPFKRAPLVVGI